MDRDILECLYNGAEKELVLTPAMIAENLDWSREAVRKHVLKLKEYGLIEYHDEDRAIYRLSNRGRAWLEGDLSTEELGEDED